MSQRLVAIVGKNNTQAEVSGQNELLVKVTSFGGGAGLATETTLQQVLAAVDNMRDYEVRLVEDSDTPKVTWLEVRYWDAQSGTLGTPQYYLPGSTTPGSPVLPISYINSQTLLSQIYAELQAQSTTLTTIESETVNLDVPISTLGTEATLGIIKGILTDFKNDFNAEDFATETTLGLLKVTIDALNAKFVGGNDIGDVTINNTSSNPVPISDGGGSITVDGSVTAIPSGTQDVNITSTIALPVTDNGGSLTVDGTVNIGTMPEVEIKNDSGNPIPISDAGGSLTVDGTVTANQGTSPWVVSGTVTATPTGTQDVNIVSGVTLEVNLDQNNDQVQVYGSDLTAPISTDTSGHLQVDVLTIPEVEIKNDSGNPIPVNGTVAVTQSTSPWIVDTTGVTRTPSLVRATGAGSISAGARSISVFNAGSAAGSVLGVAGNILPGEVFEFSAGGENDTLSAFAYDGTGTTLVITSIV